MEKDNNNLQSSLWQNLAYKVLFGIWYAISKLPLCILYMLSTLVAEILYYVVRYRRKLVRKNLADSFPNLSKRELWIIERKFYFHFCDMLFESLKFFSISKEELMRRYEFKGTEQLEDSARRGKSCGIFLGHYGNWEWGSSLPLWLDKDLIRVVQLYHPLENPIFDRLIGYTRERMGGTNIPANESLRHIVKYRKEGKPLVIGFIADQVPLWNNIHYWTNFLNHPETPVFTGAERLMQQLDMDVYYLDVKRVKRGHYVVEMKLITTTPKDFQRFELTEIYCKMLEQTINAAPPYWLWSHNRWKRGKAEWEKIKEIYHSKNKHSDDVNR